MSPAKRIEYIHIWLLCWCLYNVWAFVGDDVIYLIYPERRGQYDFYGLLTHQQFVNNNRAYSQLGSPTGGVIVWCRQTEIEIRINEDCPPNCTIIYIKSGIHFCCCVCIRCIITGANNNNNNIYLDLIVLGVGDGLMLLAGWQGEAGDAVGHERMAEWAGVDASTGHWRHWLLIVVVAGRVAVAQAAHGGRRRRSNRRCCRR